MLRAFSSKISHSLKFTAPNALSIPTFQVIDLEGEVKAQEYVDGLDKAFALRMHRTMCEVHEFDSVFYDLQRQGKISFYMQNSGEEGIQAGCAAGLQHEDWVYPQYRELGVFFWRGFDFLDAANQLYSNVKDLNEGKQMPMHFGSRAAYIQTTSSPLSTQVPQASGLGYALRLKKLQNICVAFFGDGAASEGDVHAAMNFAATRESQTLFFVRNNQYAISTPLIDQFRSDGIAVRGVGYGIPAIRVDGNDVLAVLRATEAARALILQRPGPVLLEAMSYRGGHHSTSDDSSRYRPKEELSYWQKTNHPIVRFEKFLTKQGWLDFDLNDFKRTIREQVLKAKATAEKEKFPGWKSMFTGVYDTLPWHLEAQQAELAEHLKKYPDAYDLHLHEDS
jgi:2-oxoisovalerate dehydrogenase E1 component alpha subunit